MLSQVAAPFYIITSRAWGFQFCHIVYKSLGGFFVIAVLLVLKWYLIVILIFIFPEGEWCWASYKVLLAICIFPLEKCLSKSFIILEAVVWFLMLNCKSSVYILKSLIRHMACKNFSHSVGCLFTLSLVSFSSAPPTEGHYVFGVFLNFNEIQLIYFFFCCLWLWYHI